MSVKLYYFNGLGRGEVTRWILHHGNIEFEDNRFEIPLPADIKAKARWGQVPLVELGDGKSLTQSVAISRYFARKANLIPDDPYLAALADEYVDAVQDIINPLYKIAFMTDEKEKAEKLKETVASHKTKFFDVFDNLIKANGGKHLVGDKLSWADLWLAFTIDQMQLIFKENIAEGRVHVNKLHEEVVNSPKIKAWIAKRPATPF